MWRNDRAPILNLILRKLEKGLVINFPDILTSAPSHNQIVHQLILFTTLTIIYWDSQL